MTAALLGALERRVRGDRSRPLLTWYDLDSDARVELSGRTFANWVDKTANLLATIGADDQPAIGIPLLLTHPGHWVGLVWTMATWQVGGKMVALPRDQLKLVEVAVVGPDNVHPVPGAETVACSLHPLGLAFPQPVPAVIDFAEVLTQPDVHWSSPASATHVAWRGADPESRLLGSDVDSTAPDAARRLIVAAEFASPWQLVQAALVGPLLGGGSSVVVSGPADAERLAHIAASEQVEA